MPLLDLGFGNKQHQIHQDLERLLYNEVNGTHASYVGIRALQNSDVFTATRIISADIASTKLKNKDHEKNSVLDDVLDLFNNHPNDELPGWHFKFIIVANMLLNGSSYVQILRDKNDFVTGFYFLHNDLVSLEEVNNKITYNVSEAHSGKAEKLEPRDILHFRYITLDGYTGYSPLYSLAYEIGISQGSKGFLRNFFDNGGTSTSVLKYKRGDINEDQLKDLKKNFANSQLKNNGGLVAIDDSMDFERLQIPTEVLNFLNSYKFSTNQVAKAFGLPVSKLGVETVNTSITQANLEYLQSTLDPIFKMMIDEMQIKIFNESGVDYDLEFDTSRLVDIDPELKLERVTTLFSKGSITLNESRKPFGYEPIEGGDDVFIDLNRIPLGSLDEYQRAKINKEVEKNSPKGGDE